MSTEAGLQLREQHLGVRDSFQMLVLVVAAPGRGSIKATGPRLRSIAPDEIAHGQRRACRFAKRDLGSAEDSFPETLLYRASAPGAPAFRHGAVPGWVREAIEQEVW